MVAMMINILQNKGAAWRIIVDLSVFHWLPNGYYIIAYHCFQAFLETVAEPLKEA